MSRSQYLAKIAVGLLAAALCCLMLQTASWGATGSDTRMIEARKLELVVGKSTVLQTAKAAKRVSVANPDIAELVLVSPHEIYITGKAPGLTNLTLWHNKEVSAVYDLEVRYDISRLKQKINELLPGETNLRVMATHNSVTLAGKVSSAARLSQIVDLAREYAPESRINNMVEVGGVHQVMLEVRVAEMNRSMGRRLGINFNYATESGKFGINKLAGLTEVVSPDDANIASSGPFGILTSSVLSGLLRFTSSDTTWTAFIDALKEQGLVKILAKPTLVALSGHDAQFLAGGEFPVPVPQGLGTAGIEYKQFGVGLAFTPTVLSKDRISIKVAPEVSELDFSTAVQVEGYVVPGLSTRKASTVVELADGQSFAIAGLLRDTVRDAVSKFPLLGDIPILGKLFRSRSFQKNETELIIVATPHLVKPLDLEEQPMPTDFYIEPNDEELYIWGLMEGSHKGGGGKFEGDFGHVVPEPGS